MRASQPCTSYLHRETPTLFNLGSFSIRIKEVHTVEICRGESKVKESFEQELVLFPKCYRKVGAGTRNFVGEL